MNFFYRAMHFSAKRGLAIACRPSVSVCDVGDLWSHRLHFVENYFTAGWRRLSSICRLKHHDSILKGTPPNFCRNRSVVAKISNFRHLSHRISETVQDGPSYYWSLIGICTRAFDWPLWYTMWPIWSWFVADIRPVRKRSHICRIPKDTRSFLNNGSPTATNVVVDQLVVIRFSMY